MSKLPNYKSHVMQRIPLLETLDGQKIEAGERDAANHAIEKERSVMAILIHNDALLHKMVCALPFERAPVRLPIRTVPFGFYPCMRN